MVSIHYFYYYVLRHNRQVKKTVYPRKQQANQLSYKEYDCLDGLLETKVSLNQTAVEHIPIIF